MFQSYENIVKALRSDRWQAVAPTQRNVVYAAATAAEGGNMNCTDCKRRYVGKGWICWSGNKKSIGACNNGNPTKGRIVYRKGETRKEKT